MVNKEYRKSKTKKRAMEYVHFIDNIHSLEEPSNPADYAELQEFLGLGNNNVLRMRYEGYTQKEIATELGVSQSYVSGLLKQMKDDYHEYN